MLFTACTILCAAVLLAGAQDIQWKTGDKIEIRNLSKEWVPGTILGTVDWNGKLLYRVKLDDDNAPNVYFNHTDPADIRARGGKPANPPATQNNAGVPVNIGNAAFNVGDTVDAYFNDKEGNRGEITEVGDRRYKVHFRGCGQQFQNWFDANKVHSPANLSATAPEVTFLIGKWRTTTVAVGGNYAAWGSSPGIQLNADGTYIWYEYSGRPPVKGKWIPYAKVPNVTTGTPKFDGVLVKDSAGLDWKVFKWDVKDGKDHIEIDRLCSGQSEVGSRVN